MLPSTLLTGSASAVLWLSRLNSTPHTIAVYASHPPSPATTQHSLPGARYGLPGPVSHRQDHASFPGAQAIHSFFARRDGLLRGACHRARIRATRWLAMTSKHTFTPSPREAPEPLINLPPKEGVGNAGCPLHPRPRVHLVVVERTRVTTSTPESPDVPARNGFNGFLRALVSAKSARMWERAVLTNRPLLDLSPFVLEGL